MNFKFSFFNRRLPKGYSIVVWKNNTGQKRYSLFWGDDRLMSFTCKTEATNYAVEISNQAKPYLYSFDHYAAPLQAALPAR